MTAKDMEEEAPGSDFHRVSLESKGERSLNILINGHLLWVNQIIENH